MAVCCTVNIAVLDLKNHLNLFATSSVNMFVRRGIQRNNFRTCSNADNLGRVSSNMYAHRQTHQLINKTTGQKYSSCTFSNKNISPFSSCRLLKNLKYEENRITHTVAGCIGVQSFGLSVPQRRYYCDDRSSKQISLPRLMDFPQVAWPNIFKVIRNWILANFVITPYFDREFQTQDFLAGSKQAVEFVSQCLAKGDYDKLKDVVAPDALEEIKNSISRFSVQQRADLAVCKDDIYFCFPYQVGVMFNETERDSQQQQQRFVEITVVYHVLRGLQELQAQTGKPALNVGATAEFQDKVFILNYRFIREFTKGVSAEWTINVVNHYRPSDYV